MAKRIIDACCLINLYASGKEMSIIDACGEFYISKHVLDEALRIREFDKTDPTKVVPKDIDLSDARDAELILLCQLDGQEEFNAFIQFAKDLDDGEASCLAIAKIRGWVVATDDRKARRIASENGIDLVSTPELIHKWTEAISPDENSISEVLQRIGRFAKYRPRRNDPLYSWWIEHLDESSD